jgi:polysaccharide export outer membrane protein
MLKKGARMRNPFIGLISMALICVGLPGCFTWGTVSGRNLSPELQAPPVRNLKTLDLARIGKPIEEEPRFQPGDLVEVSVSDLFVEHKTEAFPVRIEEGGEIQLPFLRERIPLDALTSGEAEQTIRVAYTASHLLRNPQVTVRMLEPRTNKVYVLGAVKSPGTYSLRTGESDLLRAIVAAGGLTPEAGTIIEIRRSQANASPAPTGPAKLPHILADFKDPSLAVNPPAEATNEPQEDTCLVKLDLANEDDVNRAAGGFDLRNGDIVSIEQKKFNPFYVTGSVNRPGEYSMPVDRDIHVLQAISLAGGVLRDSNPTHALLLRRMEGKPPVTIHVRLDRASRFPEENVRLMAGDTLSVEEDLVSTIRKFVRTTFRVGTNIPLTQLF